jgi:hypothetical protein
MTSDIRLSGLLAIILAIVSISASAQASGRQTAVSNDDEVELTAMLHDFLGASGQREAHAGFWADDLVYTSSTGQRFGKAEILSGFDEPAREDDAGPGMDYSGEDVKVQLFGTTAIITFKLVGTPDDGSEVKNYFNTGTFLKRGGEWHAVAWQATVIPVP